MRRRTYSLLWVFMLITIVAQIRSCAEYCSHLWDGSAKYLLNALDSLQRRAVRIIGVAEVTRTLEPLQLRRDMAALCVLYPYRHTTVNVLRKKITTLVEFATTTSQQSHFLIKSLGLSVKIKNSGDDFKRSLLNLKHLEEYLDVVKLNEIIFAGSKYDKRNYSEGIQESGLNRRRRVFDSAYQRRQRSQIARLNKLNNQGLWSHKSHSKQKFDIYED